MNLHTPAHSVFGGSVAARVLNCPASVKLIANVPEHLRKASSSYADRGTALHSAMARLIEGECSFDDLVGVTINDYALAGDDVEDAVRPAYAYVDALLSPEAEYFLEARVEFPGIDGAFGTPDLIVRVGNVIHVVDFKFGSGVRVLALYPDGDEDIVNGQLLFYAAAARHTFPNFFAGVADIVLTILQPQSIELDAELVSTVTVTPAELDEFVTLYSAACAEALTDSPRLERGAHCRFCPARPCCPAHTGPLLDLAQFAAPRPLAFGGTFAAPPEKEAYLQLLAAGLNLVDVVKDIGKALHDQAKRALENGDLVVGHTLSTGRAVRHWRDEASAAPDLLKLGLVRGDVLVESLRSPKQVELRAKARGVKVPKELIVSRPSGVSLVRAENARAPVVPGRGEIVRSFTEALSTFQKGSANG